MSDFKGNAPNSISYGALPIHCESACQPFLKYMARDHAVHACHFSHHTTYFLVEYYFIFRYCSTNIIILLSQYTNNNYKNTAFLPMITMEI